MDSFVCAQHWRDGFGLFAPAHQYHHLALRISAEETDVSVQIDTGYSTTFSIKDLQQIVSWDYPNYPGDPQDPLLQRALDATLQWHAQHPQDTLRIDHTSWTQTQNTLQDAGAFSPLTSVDRFGFLYQVSDPKQFDQDLLHMGSDLEIGDSKILSNMSAHQKLHLNTSPHMLAALTWYAHTLPSHVLSLRRLNTSLALLDQSRPHGLRDRLLYLVHA